MLLYYFLMEIDVQNDFVGIFIYILFQHGTIHFLSRDLGALILQLRLLKTSSQNDFFSKTLLTIEQFYKRHNFATKTMKS